MCKNNLEDKKILIVDDEEEIREIISRVFSRLNYDVTAVEDGIAALESIKTFKPDLIFLDIMMPGMNGVQFLRKVAPLKTKPYKIVVVSGFINEETKEECIAFGVQSIIHKPFDIKTIVKVAKDSFLI